MAAALQQFGLLVPIGPPTFYGVRSISRLALSTYQERATLRRSAWDLMWVLARFNVFLCTGGGVMAAVLQQFGLLVPLGPPTFYVVRSISRLALSTY